MKLIFVRHGQTDFNKEGRMMGQDKDLPLNEIGMQQVAEAVQLLPDNIDLILSSPLKRALQTAEIINSRLHKTIQVRDDLKEISYGSLAGKTWTEIEEETGGACTEEKDVNVTFDYTPFGGESAQDFKKRVAQCIEDIRVKYSDRNILITGHGGIIDAMHALFPQKEKRENDNAAMHEFIF